jgi:hypothetical protein
MATLGFVATFADETAESFFFCPEPIYPWFAHY